MGDQNTGLGRRGVQRRSLDWLPIRHGFKNYSLQKLGSDMKAGVNVALLDFPQAMAYALIAGFPIQFGIYGSAIGSILGPLFASSRFLMLGPTNSTSVLLATTFLALDMTREQSMVALPFLIVMVGMFLILASVFRLANIVRYVSRSVIAGYVTAAALLIIVNQISTLFGFERPRGSTFVEILEITINHFSIAHWEPLALGLVTVITFFILKFYFKSWPHVALTLFAMAGVGYMMHSMGGGLKMLSAVNPGSWDLTPPEFDFELMRDLGNAAIALSFLIMVESASVSKTLAARAGDVVDLNQQMFSIGVANMGSAIGSGITVSGSLARSQLNFESGAKSPFASIFSGLILVTAVLLVGPYFGFIPRAALAVLVIIVGFSIIHTEVINTVMRTTKADAIVFLTTFLSGLVFHLESAIFIGVAISILFFLKKVGTPQLIEFAFNEEGELTEKNGDTQAPMPEISIVHVEGDLFFGSTDIFLEQMRLIVDDDNLRIIILRMRNAHHMDATSAMAIMELVRFAREKERDLLVSGALPEVEEVFRNSKLMNVLGEENFFPHISENPNKSTRNALKRAQEIMGKESANIKLFVPPKKEETH